MAVRGIFGERESYSSIEQLANKSKSFNMPKNKRNLKCKF